MKFNIKSDQTRVFTNHEGERAYAMKQELELYTAVVTTTLSNTNYEPSSERMERIRRLVNACDPVFVAKLTVYARTVMNMRSVPMYLACLLAQKAAGTRLVSTVVDRIVLRADEITELMSCYAIVNARTDVKKLDRVAKQVQKGLATAFNRFDEFQFAKYDRNAAVTLRDALFLVHPKAKDEGQQVIFDKIATRTLATPYTWETTLAAVGQRSYENARQRDVAFTAAWEQLIDSGRVGYMALLRNLRNIVQANVTPSSIEALCSTLSDPNRVKESKQFPFRYLSAYRQLLTLESSVAERSILRSIMWMFSEKRTIGVERSTIQRLLEALEEAVVCAAGNIPGFEMQTRVLIACDVSGSMQVPISKNSTVTNYDVGLMLAMLLQSTCTTVEVGMFGSTWKIIPVPTLSILANVLAFHKREGEVGYSTNGYLVIQDLIQRRVVMDKVMVFTDCQLWNSNDDGQHLQRLWAQYREAIAPRARLYLFDLAGHGQAPLSLNNEGVAMIAGWNERIFEVMMAIENGATAFEAIHQMEL